MTHHTNYLPDEWLKTKLLRNGFWLYFFAIIIAPSGYLVKMLIAQSLSVEEIGIFYSLLGMIMLLSTYNDLGLTEALQYYLPNYLLDKRYDESKSIFVYTLLLQLISSVVIGSLVRFGAGWLSEHYFHSPLVFPLLRFFSLYFLLLNLCQAFWSFFIALQYVKRSQLIEAVRMRTVVLGTALLMLMDDVSLTSFTLVWLVGTVLGCIVAVTGVYHLFGKLFRYSKIIRDSRLFRKQWKYGIWVMLGASASSLLWQVNQQFALYTLWPAQAGIWAYYLSFYTMVGVVINPLISYLFPLLNELYKKQHHQKIQYLFQLLFSGIIIFGVVGAIIAYLAAPWIAGLLFGEQFVPAGELFQHYAPFLFTLPLLGIFFQDIAARGLVKQRVAILTLWLLVNTLACFFLGWKFGLTWLVYAQLLGNIVLILGGWYYFQLPWSQKIEQ